MKYISLIFIFSKNRSFLKELSFLLLLEKQENKTRIRVDNGSGGSGVGGGGGLSF